MDDGDAAAIVTFMQIERRVRPYLEMDDFELTRMPDEKFNEFVAVVEIMETVGR